MLGSKRSKGIGMLARVHLRVARDCARWLELIFFRAPAAGLASPQAPWMTRPGDGSSGLLGSNHLQITAVPCRALAAADRHAAIPQDEVSAGGSEEQGGGAADAGAGPGDDGDLSVE